MSQRVAVQWIAEPLRAFVDDARVEVALVLRPNGQVLGEVGFTRAVDVMSACSLAAAIDASARALGRQIDVKSFSHLHHSGGKREIFIASCETGRGRHLLVAIFGEETSIGLVQLYFGQFRRRLEASAVQYSPSDAPLGEGFEESLARSLDALFLPRIVHADR